MKRLAHTNTTSERMAYLDIAKGILILMVVFHHLLLMACLQNHFGNDYVDFLFELQYSLIFPYFMPAFFVITGMCTNYYVPISVFLKKKIRQLLIPNLVSTLLFDLVLSDNRSDFLPILLNGGGRWFLTSLFCGNIFVYLLINYTTNVKVIFTILCSATVLSVINNVYQVQNVWYHIQTLDLSFYLMGGVLLRHRFSQMLNRNKWLVSSVALYFSLVLILIMTDNEIPYVKHDYSVQILMLPIHILLAFSGSFALIAMCRILKKSDILEYIGKRSLTIYIFHMYFINLFVSIFIKEFEINRLGYTIVTSFAVFISTMVICLFIERVLDVRYLRWVIGK